MQNFKFILSICFFSAIYLFFMELLIAKRQFCFSTKKIFRYFFGWRKMGFKKLLKIKKAKTRNNNTRKSYGITIYEPTIRDIASALVGVMRNARDNFEAQLKKEAKF